jgi:hypothetical protein
LNFLRILHLSALKKSIMGVSPMAVFGYENHGRDARDTGFSKRLFSLPCMIRSARISHPAGCFRSEFTAANRP